MVTATFLGSLFGLLAVVSAQAGDGTDSNVKVWAAVAYINNGERTPSMISQHSVLTPEGAQQMRRQGAAFRTRYISSNSTSSSGTAIQDMSVDAIDNSELDIISGRDEWVTSGALAFMQGLYPPKTDTAKGDLGHNFVYGTNTTDFPLDGYQYPHIRTTSESDSLSVAIDGASACSQYQDDVRKNLPSNSAVSAATKDSKDFYQNLLTTSPLDGLVPSSMANYMNARYIYDLVNYLYTHNETVYKGLKDSNETLNTLEKNAFSLERASTSSNSTDKSDPSNVLYTIAGRTLADQVTDQFSSYLASPQTHRLTMMFGSHLTLLSFFTAAGLMTPDNLASGPFSTVPKPGSAIIFELVGEKAGGMSTDGLEVRFYYRASSDDGEAFTQQPLFGSGLGGSSMSYSAWFRKMDEISKSVPDWCDICQPSLTSSFCYSSNNSSSGGNSGSGGSSSSKINPAVAGVLGALLMAVLMGCVIALLMAIFGFRIHRQDKSHRDSTASSGFKGTERKGSDPDVAVSKFGHREERVGSWELRHSGQDSPVNGVGAGIVTSEFASRSKQMEEDAVSVQGAPVNTRDAV